MYLNKLGLEGLEFIQKTQNWEGGGGLLWTR